MNVFLESPRDLCQQAFESAIILIGQEPIAEQE
jgi:hypothetical protein